MTTTERLLELAAEFQQKADALRLAATELNGHQTRRAQSTINTTVQQAIALRQQQRARTPTAAPTPTGRLSQPALQDLLRQILRTTPLQAAEAIRGALQGRGVNLVRSTITKTLRRMPDVHCIGRSRSARWQLRARPSVGRRGQRRAPQTSTDKARIVAEILQEADRPLLTRELTAAARARGLSGLTGIYNYVRLGYVTVHGRNPKTRTYRFKALPPAPEAAPDQQTDSRAT